MSGELVTFWVGGAEYALPVAPVEEVLRVGPIAPIPRAAPAARGLTRVRGRLVPVVDTAVALGLPASAIDERSRVVIVSRGARLVGLLVDRVAALRDPDADEPPPVIDLDRILEAG